MNGMKRPAFQASLNDCVVTPTYVGQGFKKMQTNNKPSAQDPWMSPIKWTSTLIKKLPPTFIAHGGAETLVDEGVEFIKKAQHNGVKIQHDSRPG
jgi:acetyl esterase/lipase